MTYPTVTVQQQWARQDGFNVWDNECHKCGETMQEGEDCSQGHYDAWLQRKTKEMSA